MKLLETLRRKQELSSAQIAEACDYLFDSSVPVPERANVLEALAQKGETATEISGFVDVLLNRSTRIAIPADATAPLLDVCGTGGDRLGLFNVSTAVMFVAAACGARVVKHGNRGVTSKCGGADVLESLGVKIDTSPARAAEVLASVGCVFLFAPVYHPTFREVAPVRKLLAEQGVTTIFNKLGPLLNPASPETQLAGVFDPAMIGVYGDVFRMLGRRRAWAVHGSTPAGGLDEMSISGPTVINAWDGATLRRFTADAAEFGIRPAPVSTLRGGDATQNAAILMSVLKGEASGPIEDMVVWNSAGALVASGIAATLADAVTRARKAVKSGQALDRFERLRAA